MGQYVWKVTSQDFTYISIVQCNAAGSGAKSVAMFSCDEGHRLEGPENMQCSIFGEWSTNLPTCKCKLHDSQ